ncbi:hypothetical protein GCM10010245_92200 [Streptomyces spectabilis]|nr:hypothetical protein GCM10010245_92200 [Streptomyces spectabilis]
MRARHPIRAENKGAADTDPSPASRPAEDRQQTPPGLRRQGGPVQGVFTTAANLNDVTQTLALTDGTPPPATPTTPAARAADPTRCSVLGARCSVLGAR